MKLKSLITPGVYLFLLFAGFQTARAAVTVRITVENIAPSGGVALTPVWVGFHSGNFDAYNRGPSAGRATVGIERLAEDGDTGQITTDFANGLFGLAGGQTGPDQGDDDPDAFIREVLGDR